MTILADLSEKEPVFSILILWQIISGKTGIISYINVDMFKTKMVIMSINFRAFVDKG